MPHAQEETLKQKKRRLSKEELIEMLWVTDLKDICDNVKVRKFIWTLMGKCHYDQTPYSKIREETYMRMGKQDIGRWLKGEIVKADPALWVKMELESLQGVYDGSSNE